MIGFFECLYFSFCNIQFLHHALTCQAQIGIRWNTLLNATLTEFRYNSCQQHSFLLERCFQFLFIDQLDNGWIWFLKNHAVVSRNKFWVLHTLPMQHSNTPLLVSLPVVYLLWAIGNPKITTVSIKSHVGRGKFRLIDYFHVHVGMFQMSRTFDRLGEVKVMLMAYLAA